MKPENYSERNIEVDGWQVHLTTYQLGQKFHCTADNVSPGANLARVSADSREVAEERALARAKELLSKSVRRQV